MLDRALEIRIRAVTAEAEIDDPGAVVSGPPDPRVDFRRSVGGADSGDGGVVEVDPDRQDAGVESERVEAFAGVGVRNPGDDACHRGADARVELPRVGVAWLGGIRAHVQPRALVKAREQVGGVQVGMEIVDPGVDVSHHHAVGAIPRGHRVGLGRPDGVEVPLGQIRRALDTARGDGRVRLVGLTRGDRGRNPGRGERLLPGRGTAGEGQDTGPLTVVMHPSKARLHQRRHGRLVLRRV